MYLAFLDEFGHIGPFVSRLHSSHNHSPVFGLAGYVMPHHSARDFATWFFQFKNQLLARQLRQVTKHPATWEMKGTELFTTKSITKYSKIEEGLNRLFNKIYKLDGKFFFYGREKYQTPSSSNATGLYTTVLGHTIRQTDRYVTSRRSQFLMIMDQHKDRIKLLETSAKTMFGAHPAKSLIEPPFHVESHLYQTIQAADWVATIVGRALAYRASPTQYTDWAWADRIFTAKVEPFSTHSVFWRPNHGLTPSLP